MKSIVLDTNVLLDLFVFNDFRALHLKQALLEKQLDALSTSKTLAEFADVISRPLFSLEQDTQKAILDQWRMLSRQISDDALIKAPWACQDPDDQVFLDLAFTYKPSVLVSKDNELLKLNKKAAAEEVMITADYNLVPMQS